MNSKVPPTKVNATNHYINSEFTGTKKDSLRIPPNGYLESVLGRYSIAIDLLNTDPNLMRKFKKEVEKLDVSQLAMQDNNPLAEVNVINEKIPTGYI